MEAKIRIGAVLGEAWRLYRLLWRRSVVAAGLIFAVVGLAEALAASARQRNVLAAVVALALGVVGNALVQKGALVEVVRDVHDGREPGTVGDLLGRARARTGSILWGALVYGFAVAIGLVLLVVPGLIVLARWALIVPIVVVERRPVREARARSSALVRGNTGRVLGAILLSLVIVLAASLAIETVFGWLPSILAAWIGRAVAGAVTVPFAAHVLTVLYYRLTEPERPVVPEPTKSWPSVWDEQEG